MPATIYDNIPLAFYNDLQSKNPQLVPLVHIDVSPSFVLKMSTVPLIIKSSEGNPKETYKPILLNVPRVSRSINFFSKDFKTSSITLSISDMSDYQKDFSSDLSNELFDKPITLYFKSQSTRFNHENYSSTSALDYCYIAFTGYVTEVNIKNDIISIEAEDQVERLTRETSIPYS